MVRSRLDRLPGAEQTSTVQSIKATLRDLEVKVSSVLAEVRQQITNVNNSRDRAPRTTEGRVGRPRYMIDPGSVRESFEQGLPFNIGARLHGVSTSTFYRRRREMCLTQRQRYTDITDQQLDNRTRQITAIDSNCGTQMAMGALITQGIRVARERVYQSLRRVDPQGVAARWRPPVPRQGYFVPCPNWIWHLDSHHKLNGVYQSRWKISIQAAVDGYSRTCVYLGASGYNTASQTLRMFLRGVREYGLPRRIRTDHGGENNAVGRLMVEIRGTSYEVHFKGPSVHNARIERFWGTMRDHATKRFINLFDAFEREGILDPNSRLDILALHFVFLPIINSALDTFRAFYNNHPVSTAPYNMSPNQLRAFGFADNIDRQYTAVHEHYNGQPVDIDTLITDVPLEEELLALCRYVRELRVREDCTEELFRELSPFNFSDRDGREKYLLAREILRRHLLND
ncbi:PREDICTED: uncharacterized protein LOC109479592 [Branchiostoma belcheri]|uniref:Uncharacterized protein LOC109479592 n=1 Tax=Branchiostoma belcheri TaxID=7741 RepID=A0A6P5A5U5_BRABE|nr:PREDICTED: uncharacterized protein LOC109479592 [Branchiostoma belcheri]